MLRVYAAPLQPTVTCMSRIAIILVLLFCLVAVSSSSAGIERHSRTRPLVFALFWPSEPRTLTDLQTTLVNFFVIYPDGRAALIHLKIGRTEDGGWAVISEQALGLAIGTWSGEPLDRIVIRLSMCYPRDLPGHMVELIHTIERRPKTMTWYNVNSGPHAQPYRLARDLFGAYDREEKVLRLIGDNNY
jgi:hypothetical protein